MSDDSFYPDISNMQPRTQQTNIASTAVRASNAQQLYGDPRTGYVLLDYLNARIAVYDGQKRLLVNFNKNGLTFYNTSGTALITIDASTQVIKVGGSNVTIDGANSRILVNDGTNDRVLIGFQSGAF